MFLVIEFKRGMGTKHPAAGGKGV